MTAAIISAAVSLTVAVLGFWFTFRNTKRLSERNDRLVRVNRQLSELYGPMLTLTATSDAAWRTFVHQYNPSGMAVYDASGGFLLDEKEWMRWVRTVFMPLNRQLFEKILKGGDLLLDGDMPPELLEFAAHVSSLEALLARWDEGDTAVMTAAINHPGRPLYRYAEASFSKLKTLQHALLSENPTYFTNTRLARGAHDISDIPSP